MTCCTLQKNSTSGQEYYQTKTNKQKQTNKQTNKQTKNKKVAVHFGLCKLYQVK